MSGRNDVDVLWEMLTHANAAIFGIDKYGLAAGREGSVVVYDAATPFEALRRRAPRTLVLNRGREVARTEPAMTTVVRGDDERTVDYTRSL